jgi:S1-C subfamily serine protease
MEEPPALFREPDDEEARLALDAGTFSGLVLGDARDSLDALLEEPEGVLVTRVVENSPADAAGLVEGDLLLACRTADGEEALAWPSEWRSLELESAPGTRVTVVFDRAGSDRTAELELVPRVRPAARGTTVRLREEDRVGVVVRSATEAEARNLGLAPGGGAIVVGLARSSPWRAAGLVFEDAIRAVDDEPLAHPQELLDAIRATPKEGTLRLAVTRDGDELVLDAPVSRRSSELTRCRIPLIYSYEAERGSKRTSVLFGLYGHQRTPAAWTMRLLWFISFGGGDADRLEEVDV